MPGTLFRYLMRSYMERFSLVLLVVAIGLLLSNSFDTLNRFRSVTFTLPLFISFISLKLPYLLIEIMPMIVFIGILMFLYYFSRTHQLVSIWATGTSTWRVLLPVALSAILIGSVMTTVVQPVASMLIGKYDTMEAKLLKRRSNIASISGSGIMIAEDYKRERRIVTARSVDIAANKLHGVTILFIDEDNNFISRLDAEEASLHKGRFMLHNVKNFDSRLGSGSSEVEKSRDCETSISIDRFTKSLASPEHVSFWRLPLLIQKLKQAGMPALRYQVYYYKQLFKPLMMMTVCFMAFCFINPKQNRLGGAQIVALGVFMGFIVYLMSEICIVILMNQGFDVIVANLCPMVVIILLSIFAILHLHETG